LIFSINLVWKIINLKKNLEKLWSGYQGKEEKEDVQEKRGWKVYDLEADQWLNRKEWCLGSGRR
jgi:hypothetical protein